MIIGQKPFEEKLLTWDRERYGVFCRRLEVLIIHGLTDNVYRAFRDFFASMNPEPPTINSHVGDCLPVRIADTLEWHGYETLAAVDKAPDQELLLLRNFGELSLGICRNVIANAKHGKRIKLKEPELLPRWEVDWQYLAEVGNKCKAERKRLSRKKSLARKVGDPKTIK